jgi:hypothetical protein
MCMAHVYKVLIRINERSHNKQFYMIHKIFFFKNNRLNNTHIIVLKYGDYLHVTD